MEGAVTGMSGILTTVGDVVTSAIGWMGDFASLITAEGNEIMLLFVLLPLVGLGIGLLKRMISL